MARTKQTKSFLDRIDDLDYDTKIREESIDFINRVKDEGGYINGADSYATLHHFLLNFSPLFVPSSVKPYDEILFCFEALLRLKNENEKEEKTEYHIEITSEEIRKEKVRKEKKKYNIAARKKTIDLELKLLKEENLKMKTQLKEQKELAKKNKQRRKPGRKKVERTAEEQELFDELKREKTRANARRYYELNSDAIKHKQNNRGMTDQQKKDRNEKALHYYHTVVKLNKEKK